MVNLRKASAKDFDFYYGLKCEPSSVYWSGFVEAPTVEGLKSFWRKLVEQRNTEREILFLEEGG